MAKKTSSNLLFCLLAFVVGLVGSFYIYSYIKLPASDSVQVGEEYYTPDFVAFEDYDADISVHFLELGNKYTGDCTYIKTKDADILVDCGSKTNSIPYVSAYLNKYVTDGVLEYVIVTHAHMDHYAGFATSVDVDSIFDLFECETIIDFAKTNQTGKTYQNYLRERDEAIANGAKHYTALDCINQTNGATQSFEIGENISLNILNSYYYTHSASTENDYSVCFTISTENKNFLFTGDLEKKGEEKLIELNDLPKIDLYKAGHHGSTTSSSTELLEVIQPKVVCVCCCAGSSEYTDNKENQFPTQTFIDNVSAYTQEIYVTSLCVDYKNNLFTSFNGNIVYACNTNSYQVFCSNNNTILKESEWFKENRIWRGK